MATRVYNFRIDPQVTGHYDDEWQDIPVELTDEEYTFFVHRHIEFVKSKWFKKRYDSGTMDEMIGLFAPEIFRRIKDAIKVAAPIYWPDVIDKIDQFDIYLPRVMEDDLWDIREKEERQKKSSEGTEPKTDYHCHILPGIDDGAKDIEESLFLARKLVSYGFERAVCTAHSAFRYRNTPETVFGAFKVLKEVLQEHSIPLELVPTMEYRIIPETWPDAKYNGWLIPWGGNRILIEFPIKNRKAFGDLVPQREIEWLLHYAYQPVLAHPERYHYLDKGELARLHDLGCEFQMNIGAIYGFYDDKTRKRAEMIGKEGWYSYIGTDLHNKKYADFYDSILICNTRQT